MSTENFSGLTYSDVLIEPQYSEVMSRSTVDVTSDFGFVKLSLPVISANMKDITGSKMAIEMNNNGGLGILHRFNSVDDAIKDFQEVKEYIDEIPCVVGERFEPYHIAVSVGVKDEDLERFERLYYAGARIFTIDVAHGHHLNVKNMIKVLRSKQLINDKIFVIAGNIATPQAAKDLIEWGADAVKVGIGPGGFCETRTQTGVGVPQLEALWKIRTECPDILMIADGGIKTTGDISKALKFADAVMIGSFIAGTTETPGNVYQNEKDEFYKVAGGSASGENKVKNGQKHSFVEGHIKTIPFRGHVKYILRKIKENLQSAFSYSGSNSLKEYQRKCILKPIGGGARKESKYQS